MHKILKIDELYKDSSNHIIIRTLFHKIGLNKFTINGDIISIRYRGNEYCFEINDIQRHICFMDFNWETKNFLNYLKKAKECKIFNIISRKNNDLKYLLRSYKKRNPWKLGRKFKEKYYLKRYCLSKDEWNKKRSVHGDGRFIDYRLQISSLGYICDEEEGELYAFSLNEKMLSCVGDKLGSSVMLIKLVDDCDYIMIDTPEGKEICGEKFDVADADFTLEKYYGFRKNIYDNLVVKKKFKHI